MLRQHPLVAVEFRTDDVTPPAHALDTAHELHTAHHTSARREDFQRVGSVPTVQHTVVSSPNPELQRDASIEHLIELREHSLTHLRLALLALARIAIQLQGLQVDPVILVRHDFGRVLSLFLHNQSRLRHTPSFEWTTECNIKKAFRQGFSLIIGNIILKKVLYSPFFKLVSSFFVTRTKIVVIMAMMSVKIPAYINFAIKESSGDE